MSLFAIALFALTGSAARAADAEGCHDPDWAKARLPGYEIESCETKVWASTPFETADGDVRVGGRREVVSYRLAVESKDAANETARKFYMKQGVAAGGKVKTDPDGGWNVSLQKTTPQGQVWMRYEHGSGNDASTLTYTLTTLVAAPAPQSVVAEASAAPLESAAGPCKDPPWLRQSFPGFALQSCQLRDFDRFPLELKDGDKTVAGAALVTDYALKDGAGAPVDALLQTNFIHALEKMGAKLVSDPEQMNVAIFTQPTPQGAVWYVYRQGGGNSDNVNGYELTTIRQGAMPRYVKVSDSTEPIDVTAKTCAPPPWLVQQFPYFKLDRCEARGIANLKLDLPDGEKTIVGRIYDFVFAQSDKRYEPMKAVLWDNYVGALGGIGAKLISARDNMEQAVLTRATPHGEYWYVYDDMGGTETSTGNYRLTVVEIGGPPPKSCTLQVYGVNFDFNKSAIRPDSGPVLKQVLALFTGDPRYSAEIGGHTDNVGKHAYNMKLSARRAEAVKAWLVAHDVAASRMTTAGYGDTRPLVPNTSEENRFRNRRVELKRKACKEAHAAKSR